MNLIELKAQAYDIIAQLEFLQNKLKETNDKIAELLKQENDNNQVNP
jgi:hypothetical protein